MQGKHELERDTWVTSNLSESSCNYTRRYRIELV
jgi:hypothetical protein